MRNKNKSNPSKTGGAGAKRMREFGYKAVAVWLDAAEYRAVKAAAEKLGSPVASYVRKAAVEAAGGQYHSR